MNQHTYPRANTQPREPNALATCLKAASIIGTCIWILTFLCMLLIYSIADPYHSITWAAVKEALLVATVFAISITCILTITWASAVVQRADQQRKRDWRMQDEDRQNARIIGEQLKGQPPPNPVTGARVHLVAFRLLQRHATGMSVTRDDSTAAGICTQAEWNAANQAFKTIGWKKGNTLTAAPDLNLSWPLWESHAYLDNKGTLWARPPKGKHVLIA